MDSLDIRDDFESFSQSDAPPDSKEIWADFRTDLPSEVLNYECLNLDQLMRHMSESIHDVFQVLHLPQTVLRLLLTYFKWDKDFLIESYFNANDSGIFLGAGLKPSCSTTDVDLPSLELLSLEARSEDWCQRQVENLFCDICCIQYTPNDLLAVGCEHFFCRSCWLQYFNVRIMEENQCDRIYCPAFNCENLVDDDSILSLITERKVRQRFQRLITNSFVRQNPALSWCPGVDCGHAARSLDELRTGPILCLNCSESFCLICGNSWHEPVRCCFLKSWLKMIEENVITSQWLSAYTKNCPKCNTLIEKDGGYNSIICGNPCCKYRFCWVCMGIWRSFGQEWHVCNRYEEKTAQKVEEDLFAKQIKLERFLFYFNRYANHVQSRELESTLYDSVQQRLEKLQYQDLCFFDTKFVKLIVDVLCTCRRTLMYTYVFAYFLKNNNHSLIFESNQSDLEKAVEQLSEFLEFDISATDVNILRQKLWDKAKYCERRRNVLLDHVQDGYEKDIWEHIPI